MYINGPVVIKTTGQNSSGLNRLSMGRKSRWEKSAKSGGEVPEVDCAEFGEA